jgi:hypothetical protein
MYSFNIIRLKRKDLNTLGIKSIDDNRPFMCSSCIRSMLKGE